jgi:membrane-bound inhibitor of C-type lysozyme
MELSNTFGNLIYENQGDRFMIGENEIARAKACVAVTVLVVSLLAGCIAPGVEETVLPERIDYVCANNRVLPVARGSDGRLAAVLIDGKQVNLQRAASAAQEKYSNERYSLYLDGERAMLEESGKVLFGPCTSPVPLPSAPRYRY